MGSKAVENATSLERFLNRHVLFVQGIDQNVPKNEVVQVLSQVCRQPQQGRIDILSAPDGKLRGTAFLNFHNEEDAAAALEKWRFGLELRGRPLRMQFSSDREFKDVIQGPLMAKFKVLIRNVPEDLAPEALFARFSQYGEIIQLHTSCDHYNQHFAIIQYVEVASVQAAIKNAHREKILNHVLLVEPYKPNATYGVLPRSINQIPSQQQQAAMTAAPAVATAASNGLPAASRSSGGSIGVLPGTTYAALQQQQELESAEQERYGHAERYSDNGGAAVPAAPAGPATSNGSVAGASAAPPPASSASLAVANFFASATGPAHLQTAPGNLVHLLTTALRHVQALDEHLCCPITTEPLVDPVIAADGNTYERLAITAWLEDHDTSPLTNEVLAHKALVPNKLVKKLVEELQGVSHPTAGDGGAAHQGTRGTADAVARSPVSVELTAAPTAPAAATGVMDGGMSAAAAPEPQVPVPVPVPVGYVPMVPPYHGAVHHVMPQQAQASPSSDAHAHHPHMAAPPPPQQQQQQHVHQHQQQHPHQPQHRQLAPQQPYTEYGQMPVMRPEQVVHVHMAQPMWQRYPVQFAYRPPGM